MEAPCDGCKEIFKKDELVVFGNRSIWCVPCSQDKPKIPLVISPVFTYSELVVLRRFIDGDTDLEVFETIDKIKDDLDYEIMLALRQVLSDDEES